MKAFGSTFEKFVLEKYSDILKVSDKLKYPYISPGGPYATNLWDWDSFWLVKAFTAVSEKLPESERLRITEHMKGTVLNFLDIMSPDGYIPIMRTDDGFHENLHLNYKAAGKLINQHKPCIIANALQISEFTGDFSWIEEYLPKFQKYLEFYKNNQFDAKTGLYVFRTDIMIGMDNNPAAYGRPDGCCADTLLNCFMYGELNAFAKLLSKTGKNGDFYAKEAANLKNAVNYYLYDEYTEFYYPADVNVKVNKRECYHTGMDAFWNCLPVKIRMWSGFMPLQAGIADEKTAKTLVLRHFYDKNFVTEYGVCTIAKTEKMYNNYGTANPSNWLGPVWGVSNYVLYEGLKKYGFTEQAEEIAIKTISLFENDIKNTGNMSECYNSETGETVTFNGFIGWNLLGMNMLRDLNYGK